MRSSGRFSLLLILALLVVGAVPATAQTPPPTLTGETLFEFFEPTGPTPRRVEVSCERTGESTFTATIQGNVAVGPYPGTFTETISGTIAPQTLPAIPDGGPFTPYSYGFGVGPLITLDAAFEITPSAPNPLYESVTGLKQLVTNDPSSIAFCFEVENEVIPSLGGSFGRTGYSVAAQANLTYTATIHTSGGAFTDEGTSTVLLREGYITGLPPTRVGVFLERFTSSLTQTRPALPTDSDECKNGGYLAFGVFDNQGDCVSFVETGGSNEPGQNVPG